MTSVSSTSFGNISANQITLSPGNYHVSYSTPLSISSVNGITAIDTAIRLNGGIEWGEGGYCRVDKTWFKMDEQQILRRCTEFESAIRNLYYE